MSKTQKQNLLALSVAGLVASSVAAIAGVTALNNDLTGKAVYLGYEMDHSYGGGGYTGGYTGGSAYTTSGGSPSTGTSGASTTTSTTSGPTGLNCAGGTLATCQATCTKDGVTNRFCMGYCSQECPTTSTTAGTSTTSTVTDRCAHESDPFAKGRCYIEVGACATSTSSKSGEQAFCDAVRTSASAHGMKTPVVNMQSLEWYIEDQKAAAAAPPPVVEAPAPVVVVPTVEAPSAAQDVSEEEDQPALDTRATAGKPSSLRELRPASDDDFGGEYDDFEGGDYEDFGDFGDDFGGGFHGGPDFGGDDAFMRSMMDQYGDEFSLGEDDFSGYFGDFGPEMGDDFGGGFGGGFGGDEFGGMPYMDDMGEEILGMARGFCPDEVLDEIGQALEDGEFEEIEQLMMEGCMGGEGFGGPMEDPSEIIETLRAMTDGIDLGLGVLKENGFDEGVASDIRGLLTQVNTAADEAEEACADLDFGEEEEDEDLFGLKGLLAQIFDDEEEDDDEDEDFDDEDEDFFEDDEEGGACREALEKAFYLMDPDSDEDYPNSVRGIMQPAIEDFFRKLHNEDEAKSRRVFAAFMRVMAPVLFGDEMELSDEDIDNMYDMLVENNFNFDAVGNPHAEGGEWEANFDNEDDFGGDFGEFDEEEGEGFEEKGGKAGGGGFSEEEEEFSDEDFDF